MANFYKLFRLLFFAIFIPAASTKFNKLNYQIPDECMWEGSSENDLTLVCHLKTINSEFENTNLSVIENQNTAKLRLECSNSLFFRSNLNSDTFKDFIDLRSLTIEFCKLKGLDRHSFRGLRNLQALAVRTHNADWSSMSLDIAPDTFVEFEYLKKLDLSLNNIWQVPKGIFCPIKTLQYLNLSWNEIHSIDFLNSSIQSVNIRSCGLSLIELDLSFNKIAAIASGVFSKLNSLNSLNLTKNIIKYLDDNALDGLIQIKEIDLSQNRLTALPPEIFSETKLLKHINLKNNSINVLAPGLFKNLAVLETLDLAYNELTSQWINEASFVGLKQLSLLVLSGNKITKLNVDGFNHLKNLKTLKLEYNLLEEIQNSPFEELKQLKTLSLSNNRIKIIGQETFRGLNGLLVLSLDYNQINHIQSNTFIPVFQIEDLHLNSNKLINVPDALVHLSFLKNLDLGENFITNIENTSLSKMSNLFGLRLTDNAVDFISKSTFYHHKSLVILNLSQNNVSNIESGSFKNNNQLQAIRLDSNNLNSIVDVFNDLPKLLWLNISHNKLNKFEYSHIPASLQWLDISGNNIQELNNFYDSKKEINLATLDASFNNINEISASSILNTIEDIYLNNNNIHTISPYAFFQKPKLRKVDLRNNALVTLELNALRISPVNVGRKMPKFFISSNPYQCDCKLDWLAKFNGDSRSQPELADLSLIYCNISYERTSSTKLLIETKHDHFLCKYESHCFAVCHCCDFEACDCKMECPKNCSCYHDQSWTSNVVDCSRALYEKEMPLHIPMDATELYLDGNFFINLASHTFLGRKRLKTLFLNHSFVEELQNRTFYGLLDLEILKLNNNNIHSLNGNEFQGLDNLKELYLNHNFIKSINELTFSHVYHLKQLYLDHNQLVKFAVWNHLPPYLISVSLSENPWSCDCSFLEKFHYYMITHSTIHDKHKLMCTLFEDNSNQSINVATPKEPAKFSIYFSNEYFSNGGNICHSKGWLNLSKLHDINQFLTSKSTQNFSNFDANHRNITKLILSPPESGYLTILFFVLGTLFALIILGLILFIFKDEIRVRCFSRFGIRLFYNGADYDESDRQMLFDAFISYSSKDDAFIHQELAPILEQGYPRYKICLHHRDFRDSGYETDNIIQAINISRRTIVVVSENFIKFEWKRFEYKAAFHSILRDRRRRLIVVLLENIPQFGLDADLELYLKANKYIHWGDKLFWKKIRFALPDVAKRQKSRSNMGNAAYNEDGIHLTLGPLPHHQHNVSNRDIHFLLQQHGQRPNFCAPLPHNHQMHDQTKMSSGNNMLPK